MELTRYPQGLASALRTALTRAGIRFRIIPGLTAGLAGGYGKASEMWFLEYKDKTTVFTRIFPIFRL